SVLEPRERPGVDLDAATAHPLESVARELDLRRLLREHIAERGTLEGGCLRGRILGRDVERRRGDHPGRHERRIVRRCAHLTRVTDAASMPATPSTVR